MKRVLLIAAFLLSLCVPASAQFNGRPVGALSLLWINKPMPRSLQGNSVVRLFSAVIVSLWLTVSPAKAWTHGLPPPLALDGSNAVNASTAAVVNTLTTTGGSGVIVVAIISNSSAVVSVAATGLTFTARASAVSNPPNYSFTFTAPYSSNFSGNITTTMNAGSFTTVTAFGISGSKTASFFDPNGSVPNTVGSSAPAITTSNANDFIFVNLLTSVASAGPGSGWTTINSSNFQLVEYQIVSSIQTALSGTQGSGTPNSGIMDAIEKGP
jgi:hypothetical protein